MVGLLMGTWGDVHTCTHGLTVVCSSDYGRINTFGNLLETLFGRILPVPVPRRIPRQRGPFLRPLREGYGDGDPFRKQVRERLQQIPIIDTGGESLDAHKFRVNVVGGNVLKGIYDARRHLVA